MRKRIRRFLLVEGVSFLLAALVHFGAIFPGYEHPRAPVAESIIGAVLLLGLLITWLQPALARQAAIAAQGFALLGTLIGMSMIAMGVGPRTVPDVAYHVAILVVLAWGLGLALRARDNSLEVSP
ncbi:conserved hypothetical protein [Thermobaculum terrenum ATCC BAA-798]|uniref:Uncharacterized protein n=1 Tax=Thermobaculum terrenum (strain ATCC BAA-798 / CCMEE 7001 / YNP1) TaxID=525904 RepID=D1CIV1_THET1|nr:hypothetical protein [Thermobaculum terrenum]ACZ43671.1 conserved hypothetical protein [Thermobaculum terrenum ATCC BAA-798]